MIEYSLTLPEVEKLTTKFGAAAFGTAAKMEAALTMASIAVQTKARAEAPVRTGKLRSSIVYKVKAAEGKAVIYPTVTYAEYVEGGTGLYGPKGTEIVPKNKKVLATKINPGWGSPHGDYYIIGKKSSGQKPNPFMKRAADGSKIQIRSIFKTVFAGGIVKDLTA